MRTTERRVIDRSFQSAHSSGCPEPGSGNAGATLFHIYIILLINGVCSCPLGEGWHVSCRWHQLKEAPDGFEASCHVYFTRSILVSDLRCLRRSLTAAAFHACHGERWSKTNPASALRFALCLSGLFSADFGFQPAGEWMLEKNKFLFLSSRAETKPAFMVSVENKVCVKLWPVSLDKYSHI